jgi:ABC-2 type transport system ATP-binding protein
LKKRSDKVYQIEFATAEAYSDFVRLGWELSMNLPDKRKVKVLVNDRDINRLIRDTAPLPMLYIKEIKFTLEDYFMKFYREDKSFAGVK